jgi:hypothetical protein
VLCQRPDISHSAISRVNSLLCIYTILFSCQLAGILNLKGETDKMRHLALAIALACALSGVVRAGEIHSTGAIAPPGETPTTGAVAPPGEIPGTGAATPQASGTVLSIILTLISIVP